MLMIEMSDNMQTYEHSPEQLQRMFQEMGWWSIERAQFVAIDPDGGRRPIELADVRTAADDQFRYYGAQFRYVDTGEAMAPPFEFDLRWEAAA